MSAIQDFSREQVRLGDKLWAAFGSRGGPGDGINSQRQHRNLWQDRAFFLLQGLPMTKLPRGSESWYGHYAPLFEVRS